MSVIANRQKYASTAPDVPRTDNGSVLWPEDSRAAWIQLCELARVAPDTLLGPEELRQRLWAHGEATKLTTVTKIHHADLRDWPTWR